MPKRYHRSAEGWTYVLLADRALPLNERSVFHFSPLTQADQLAVIDGLNWVQINEDGSRELLPRSSQQARELVIDHLEETENFPTDGPVRWPADGSREEKSRYLEMLSEMDLIELGNELRYRVHPELPVETKHGEVSVPNS